MDDCPDELTTQSAPELASHFSGPHESLELSLVLDAVLRRYGYDFRNYSQASLTRRIEYFAQRYGFGCISELISHLIHDASFFAALLAELSIPVTECFRDPPFFNAVCEQIIPRLRTYPLIRIWHAGCATGEEVYSMAILFHETGLLRNSLIYATDFNNRALDAARAGVYTIEQLQKGEANYAQSNGKRSLMDYLAPTSQQGLFRVTDELRKNI
ncbi:MAG: hypothetical protein KDB27_27330, partial [Planctomycetales bacterium]|nr:hypothetical protein [Planctomycetales bacterium]